MHFLIVKKLQFKVQASCSFQNVGLYGEERARNSTDTLFFQFGFYEILVAIFLLLLYVKTMRVNIEQ